MPRRLVVTKLNLRPILAGWDFEPGQITVRKIVGLDGTIKIQMRLDLGVLQLEIKGRPDGKRPNGHDSLLDSHLADLAKLEQDGSYWRFKLSPKECAELRDEAVMYYYRYLALFVLEEFEAVERDTARNLEVLKLFRNFASEPYDQYVLEQYRPYILMMNTRAKAHKAAAEGRQRAAVAYINIGLKDIRSFLESVGQSDKFDEIAEIRILRELREKIQSDETEASTTTQEEQLKLALEQEDYRKAALLRDDIRKTGMAQKLDQVIDKLLDNGALRNKTEAEGFRVAVGGMAYDQAERFLSAVTGQLDENPDAWSNWYGLERKKC